MHAVLCTVIVYLVRFGRDLRPNFFGEILPPLRRIGGLLGGYAISIGLVGEGGYLAFDVLRGGYTYPPLPRNVPSAEAGT
jgi:hypothetical protein